MNFNQLKKDIDKLKKEKNAILLVHNYQREEIQKIADILGDSLDLSRKAQQIPNQTIVFCGVRFMAETAKILSPEKTVLLPQPNASCPMAAMADIKSLQKLKAENPEAVVVTYINSTAEVKAESDVCCTSANAINVVQNIKARQIIFTPDKHLASWVQRFTDKSIIPWDGYCYVHDQFTVDEVMQAREAHPDSVVMVHPECQKGVADLADHVLSTSGMVRMARESKASVFVVGTEEGMLYRLKKENPDKQFFSLGTPKTCRGMKVTRIQDVYHALHENRFEIKLDTALMDRARSALEGMLTYV